MRFGTFHLAEAPEDLPPGEALAAELRQIVLAEDPGFDSVWLAEDHSTAPGVTLGSRCRRRAASTPGELEAVLGKFGEAWLRELRE
ncbi:MAG: LLM class flavin-dependent oxidoreductase [Chloroflexi bacterium]|nr:LLM class flavin-dependent oxidoreductase [Chloroflexota bacterium]